MVSEKQLLLTLDMLTDEGLVVPQRLRAEAVATLSANRSWVTGTGIQGYGIGEKITDTERLKEVVLKVYVEKKLPESKLKGMAKVPGQVKVEGLGESVPTDVEEIGKVEKEANTMRVRPAIPGFSVGLAGLTDAGTIGCVVQKTGAPKNAQVVYILSNSHVLADEGTATKGDEIIQPGGLDGGAGPADVIGKLTDFVPFLFSAGAFNNLVDAAIAEVKRTDVTSVIRLIGVPAGVSTRLRRGMKVQKTGQNTDHTIGIIRDVNYRLALGYKMPGGGGMGRVGFRNQVLCSRFTASGDSGSAVLNMRKQVVGLHFAGSPSSSIFNRINNVLTALGIAIVTVTI